MKQFNHPLERSRNPNVAPILCVIAIVALSTVACGTSETDHEQIRQASSSPTPPPEPKIRPAPEHTWKRGRLEIEYGGSFPIRISFHVRYGKLNVMSPSSRIPEGTTISIFGQEYPVKLGEKIHVDICDRLGGAQFNERGRLDTKIDLGIELTVKLPQREPLVTKVPVLNAFQSGGKCLVRVKNGPFLFAGEEGTEPTEPYGAVYAYPTSGQMSVVGDVKTLADVDLVGIVESIKTGRTRQCSYTSGSVAMHIRNSKITLYDRRTGKALPNAKTFSGNTSCPSTTFLQSGQNSISSTISKKLYTSWIESQLKRHVAKSKR